MHAAAARTITLPSGEAVPVLGQGTWHMGEVPSRHKEELAALRLGLDLGMSLIDTAEMYAQGGAEKLVGEAVAGRRDEVFLVTKVLPNHATYNGTIAACEGSLQRLRTDRIDLYLLHWRGRIPLDETVKAFGALVRSGAIRYWGVSNFDAEDMAELVSLPGGTDVATNQVLYNLQRRSVEYDLLPWCWRHGVPVMAYSPIEQGRLLSHPTLRTIALRHGATPAQVALAWVLRENDVNTVPKAGTRKHVRENRAALSLQLTPGDLSSLDQVFPPPTRPQPLDLP
jgi:diketogulonate reductase-like aldo/keto reductase